MSPTEKPGLVPGLHTVRDGIEPFIVVGPVFLNSDRDVVKTAIVDNLRGKMPNWLSMLLLGREVRGK